MWSAFSNKSEVNQNVEETNSKFDSNGLDRQVSAKQQSELEKDQTGMQHLKKTTLEEVREEQVSIIFDSFK